MDDNVRKIRKVVLREDYLAITGDFREAIILNQFIYWSERVKDADKIIAQENEIARKHGEIEREPLYGWIYKSAENMANEIMIGISGKQVGRYIKSLESKGFLDKRRNPKYKWDRTYQYRVNFINIALALREQGYSFSEYKLDLPEDLTKPITTQWTPMTNAETPMTNHSVTDDRAIPYTTLETNYINEIECTMVQNHKGSCTNDFSYNVLFKQIKDICLSEFPELDVREIYKIISYYCKTYEYYFGKHHPKLRNNNYRKIIEFIENCYIGVDSESYETLIDQHFETYYQGMDIDFNMNHFFTDGIITNRDYEIR